MVYIKQVNIIGIINAALILVSIFLFPVHKVFALGLGGDDSITTDNYANRQLHYYYIPYKRIKFIERIKDE